MLVKLEFNTRKHESTETYILTHKNDKLLLMDESMHFQQLIPKALRWRRLSLITTDLNEAVNHKREIDGTIKTITDRYFDDYIMFYLVYGYGKLDGIKIKAVTPITLNS